MLPKTHHSGDKTWLQQQLKRLPHRAREKAREGYEAVYKEAYDAETVHHKKENAARYEANCRLRVYVEKHIKATLL